MMILLRKGFYSLICSAVILLLLTNCFSEEKGLIKDSESSQNVDQIYKEKVDSSENVSGENTTEGIISDGSAVESNNSMPIENLRFQSTLTPQPSIIEDEKREQNTSPLSSETPTSDVGEVVREEGRETQEVKDQTVPVIEEPQQDSIQLEGSQQTEFSKVRVGMSYDEVVGVLGEPDMLVTSQKENDVFIYLWRRAGAFLYGKFENGVLTRRSGKLEEDIESVPLTEEVYLKVKLGMSLEEVNMLLKREGRKIGGEGVEDGIYLWADPKLGSSFSAKFEKGKLVRKSGFYSKPTILSELREGNEAEKTELKKDEVSAEVYVAEEGNVDETVETTSGREIVQEGAKGPEVLEESKGRNEDKKDYASSQRIVSVGRKNILEEGRRSYSGEIGKGGSKKAKLPDFTYQLREGSYEIKLHNPLDVEVSVGIRSDKRGKNVSIAPGGTRSIKVPRGEYKFFYIRADDPTRLMDGGTVKIDGLFIGDVDIYLIK
ncbi:MAG: hypothetical protein N3G21_04400 [Candidatus Hydrogenedentes bacterium]|nr:hypothetical protein [Candidatus Hydrogenedentota bacterium]